MRLVRPCKEVTMRSRLKCMLAESRVLLADSSIEAADGGIAHAASCAPQRDCPRFRTHTPERMLGGTSEAG